MGGDEIYAGPRDEKARYTVVAAGGNYFIKVVNHPAAKDVDGTAATGATA